VIEIPTSALDFALTQSNGTGREAVSNMVRLAVRAEKLGFPALDGRAPRHRTFPTSSNPYGQCAAGVYRRTHHRIFPRHVFHVLLPADGAFEDAYLTYQTNQAQ
jgi:hypothetical protein